MKNVANIESLKEAMGRIQEAEDQQEFQRELLVLQECMKKLGASQQELTELRKRAYYPRNEYSAKAEKENMELAKGRVTAYLEEVTDDGWEDDELLEILENFYLFLENLTERKPHKSGGIQKEQYEALKIKNEYDVQHLLYACLKLFYPMARAEVSEDSGYNTVRTDIFVDSQHVIEVKCTRGNMKLKKLTEEIEADMVHYSAKNIYFFLYDKEKIIENPLVFKKNYEEKVAGKKIHIIIHQPKVL